MPLVAYEIIPARCLNDRFNIIRLIKLDGDNLDAGADISPIVPINRCVDADTWSEIDASSRGKGVVFFHVTGCGGGPGIIGQRVAEILETLHTREEKGAGSLRDNESAVLC